MHGNGPHLRDSSARSGHWSRTFAALTVSIVVLGWSPTALAQRIDAAAPESLIDLREPIGIRTGAVSIYPRITADLRHDSNVYNSEAVERDDFIAVLNPTIAVRPDFSRHSLTFEAGGEFRRYFDITDENSEQYYGRIGARLDLPDRTEVNGHLLAARQIERRGTAGDQFLTDEPVAYTEKEAAIGIARVGGVVQWSAGISANDRSYSDTYLNGLPLDLSTRDVQSLRGHVRGSYRVGARLHAFAQGSVNRQKYDVEPTGPRGSSGFSVLGGLRFEPTEVTSIEGGVGYLKQTFKEPGQEDYSGLDYYLSANWAPTPRLRVAAVGSRSIERSPLPLVSAVVESDLRVSGAYAIGSRLVAGLEAGVLSQNYQGIDRIENRYFVEGMLRYSVSPQLSAFAAAGYRRQTTDGVAGREYDGTSARVGISWAL